jgi:aminoglycoside phosphotransferase
MSSANEERPTESDAVEIARRVTGHTPTSVKRFSTGIGHWVYDIRGPDGATLVVKMGTAAQRDSIEGAIHWSTTLRPLGVPLPELLAHGDCRGYPYLALERLEGEDLGQVYERVTSFQRKAIVEEVCKAQRLVGTLPEGSGYGFLRLPGGPLHKSWADVVAASLVRSRDRIGVAGLVSVSPVNQVTDHARRFSGYFSRVCPTPFLDDVTTKNVLVHEGRFSGIVDVDWLCFGDSLFTIGLTRASLLSAHADADYTDHWCDVLGLNDEERRVVDFYTALFCVDFISEFGQRFNQGVTLLDMEKLAMLEKIVNEHLEKLQ